MAYFNHAYNKTFVATLATQASSSPGTPGGVAGVTDGILSEVDIHVSNLKDIANYSLGPGVTGLFDAKTNLSVTSAEIAAGCCPFYLGAAAIKLNDKQGPFHGGYQESHKSKLINPKYIRKLWSVDGNVATVAFLEIGGTAVNVAENAACAKEFLCGESYWLRIEVKGTSALRFANHNLYQTLQADGGCCDDPANPVAVDPATIYLQWATQIAENSFFADFINPLLVIDGQAYAYNAALATAAGLDPATELFSDAPLTSTTAGLILMGAYVDTVFGDCTFQTTDYYGKEPVQLFASEVDLNGDPCTFEGLCVVERCSGVQANGLGETKVRELILSESYLQNFMANDLRIREITQGSEAYNLLSRGSIYSSYYLLHSVPRYNNPSGVFDNDQYLLEIVGTAATVTYLTTSFDAIVTACSSACDVTEDFSVTGCTFTVPNP
jgi:hypothetical protein